jgi:enamine deaminase RidA (YjgF/YER057c/UK114 family)
MSIERFMVPDELEPVSHYCHVVRAGDFIYLSGMVGMRMAAFHRTPSASSRLL